ncbi:bifunctional N(6)-L-threonylcarbamoyladenine synthase/serine/threonine protein kinase [Candidatus Woesearchaeota archaeon]|nr:bifunctional N(6)-L-threonylcarbamoyladenine synthase/serine/threonine protein kinase [Candidatus Woesearchaeota archaeon]MBI2130536.1 bifunctional N(6)-L-threonylcarbamoyladenine synthase/serine/threonine protein kinase [Candidatus Woesearchaeota archaeon]
MICLGIESTAHTFGCGIVDEKGRIYANIKNSYTTEKGGIHPTEAKIHHENAKDNVVEDALKAAKLRLDEVDLISFSHGPGLPPCLLVGMRKAKELARKINASLAGVNHCISHLEIGRLLTKAKDPVLLYPSGANTQIIAYEAGKYRIFGETLDNGVGNFIDAFARHAGLGFPGGPKIERLASEGKNYIELPYVVKGMDVSFGGLLTNLKQKYDSGKYKVEDLAFSMQETVFAMLVEVSERAMAHTGKKELLLGGGVACNKRLQEMCRTMCEERNAKFFVPEKEFLADNGAMIAWQGILQRKLATKGYDSIDIGPYERTDDVEVNWR